MSEQKVKTYELMNVLVETYQSGRRAGERKPVRLPADAIPLNFAVGPRAGMEVLYYLLPAVERPRPPLPKPDRERQG